MKTQMTSWTQAQLLRLEVSQLLIVAQTVEKIAEYTTNELADATWEALLPKVREHVQRINSRLALN